MSDAKPDWENFAKAVLTDWPTGDLDGSVLFDLSLEYGMIQEVPGGYNADHHIDAEGICPEEGDPWYEYTFRGEAGPGLYSITDMTKRIKQLAAINEELEAKLAMVEALMDAGFAEYERRLVKVVDALEAGVICTTKHGGAAEFLRIARTTIAELKGQDDEYAAKWED